VGLAPHSRALGPLSRDNFSTKSVLVHSAVLIVHRGNGLEEDIPAAS
jgi:hypothetical protein